MAHGVTTAARPMPAATAADIKPKPPIPATIGPPDPPDSASRRSRIASIVVIPNAARPSVTPVNDTHTRAEERAARTPSASPPANARTARRVTASSGWQRSSSSSGPRWRGGRARTAHTPANAETTDGTRVHETAESPAPRTASTANAATAPTAVMTEPTVTSTELVAARRRSGTTLGIAAVIPVLMSRPRPIATRDSTNSAVRPAPEWTAPAAMSAMVATIARVRTRAATATTTRRSHRSRAAAAKGPTIE